MGKGQEQGSHLIPHLIFFETNKITFYLNCRLREEKRAAAKATCIRYELGSQVLLCVDRNQLTQPCKIKIN